MTDAELMREAARTLRERAGAALPTPWEVVGGEGSEWNDQVVSPGRRPRVGVVETVADCDTDEETAEYIATMHPGLALAIADLLDDTASEVEYCATYSHHAVTVADTILGGAR